MSHEHETLMIAQQSSRLRLLAIGNRREYAADESKVQRPVPCCCGEFTSLFDPEIALNSPQIDPNRTISAGKVEIGAFRCYPEVKHPLCSRGEAFQLTLPNDKGYTPPTASTSEYQPIPLDKVEDFGVHANAYYQLDISIFKSSLDTQLLNSLWNKYWVNTLSQSPLISVRDVPPPW